MTGPVGSSVPGDTPISDEAKLAAARARDTALGKGATQWDALVCALMAAAPLLVSAEAERLAEWQLNAGRELEGLRAELAEAKVRLSYRRERPTRPGRQEPNADAVEVVRRCVIAHLPIDSLESAHTMADDIVRSVAALRAAGRSTEQLVELKDGGQEKPNDDGPRRVTGPKVNPNADRSRATAALLPAAPAGGQAEPSDAQIERLEAELANAYRERDEMHGLAATWRAKAQAKMTEGATLIAAERQRQVAVEGWTAEHDAEHPGDLALAAMAYLDRDRGHAPAYWPWALRFWKPTPDDRVRQLTKAGALVAAEIDRLRAISDRLPAAAVSGEQATPPSEDDDGSDLLSVSANHGGSDTACQACGERHVGYLFDGPDKVGHFCARHLIAATTRYATRWTAERQQ